MSKRFLEFDALNMNFGKMRVQTWRIVRIALLYLLFTIAVTMVVYLLFSLFISTDTEKRLRRENRMYERYVPEMQPGVDLLGDVVANLQYKDNAIYSDVFHSNAPAVDPMSSLDMFFASDSVPDTKITSYTRDKADALLEQAGKVDALFMKILRSVSDADVQLPPMNMPVKGVTYPQIGASSGRKMNPFYKAYVYHTGLDFIVLRGSDVFAAADGTVESTGTSKSMGKTVTIAHRSGYTTTYAHLETVSVNKGAKVSAGQKIGTVGMTGQAIAPHLHYEIKRDGVGLDPIDYLFASVSPDEYANMLYMAVNTMQSMD